MIHSSVISIYKPIVFNDYNIQAYTLSVTSITKLLLRIVMNNSPSVLVIIPAYNEEANILRTVQSVMRFGYDYLVVNDGSTDKTLQICIENHLNVLDLPQNLGIGGAVQAGHKYARQFSYDIDVQVDGDGQHDPKYIGTLIEEIQAGSDIVVGSRFLIPTAGFQSSFLRRIGITWFSNVIRLVSRRRITDPTSGFRACNKKAIELFCNKYPSDYPEPDSIVYALAQGLDVTEVSVVMRERQGGTSSISGLSSVYYMIKVTLAIFISAFSK